MNSNPQWRTAQVFAHLMAVYTEAPTVSWSVSPPTYTMPDLRGHASTGDDQADRDTVAAWATVLGADVVEEAKGSARRGFWTQVSASADITGVFVEVWAMVDQRDTERAPVVEAVAA